MSTPIPERRLWAQRIMFLLSLIGLIISTYLYITYTLQSEIVCGGTNGCDLVRLSKWASWYGIPTPLLGMAFYGGVGSLLIARTIQSSFRPIASYRFTVFIATIGFIESAFLTFVQAVEIRSFCTWCLGSAVTATLLFLASLFDRPGTVEEGTMIRILKFQFVSVLFAAVLGAMIIFALTAPKSNEEQQPIIAPYEPSPEAVSRAESFLYREGMTYLGPSEAPITLVEFLDLQCSACRAAYREVKKARAELGDRIRITYRHFPLPSHSYAKTAAYAAVCAEKQGVLFPYMDALMEGQDLTRDALIRYAAELRIDMEAFVPCLESEETHERVVQDMNDGDALGVHSTPTIFVNTIMIDGLPNASQIRDIANSL